MSSDDQPSSPNGGAIHYNSKLGTVATHPDFPIYPHSVAPSTADTFNTFALDLIPVACVGLADALFEFDSSFVTQDATEFLQRIPSLRQSRTNKSTGALPLLSVFGHADPVGSDDYNKQLSGRRAKAIYGLLIQDERIWDDLYTTPYHGDNWQSNNALPCMREALGDAAPHTRSALFAAYMAQICPITLAKSDFLGRGAAAGKADYQGCSEFNPVLLLSSTGSATLSKADRNAQNSPNRRVVIYLFCPTVVLNPNLWPCPKVEEGTGACKKRFWSDGETRRTATPTERHWVDTEDTFACRFYSRVALHSQCETLDPLPNVWLRVRVEDDQRDPRPNLPFTLSIDGVPVYSDSPLQTDAYGIFEREIPATTTQAVLTLEDKSTIALTLTPQIPPVENPKGLQIRLNNLGYYEGALDGKLGPKTEEALLHFQNESTLEMTGKPNPETNAELVRRYGS